MLIQQVWQLKGLTLKRKKTETIILQYYGIQHERWHFLTLIMASASTLSLSSSMSSSSSQILCKKNEEYINLKINNRLSDSAPQFATSSSSPMSLRIGSDQRKPAILFSRFLMHRQNDLRENVLRQNVPRTKRTKEQNDRC